MTIIEKFTPSLASLGFETTPNRTEKDVEKHYLNHIKVAGGFNHVTGTLTPMRYSDHHGLHIYLDSLTGAVEAGLVDDRRWPKQLFATLQDLQGFTDALAKFDGVRIHDRWANAFALLTSEHALTLNTAPEFAAALWEDGAPVLKHS